MGIRTPEGISVISLNTGSSYMIDKGLEFGIDEQNEFFVVAPPGKLMVYKIQLCRAVFKMEWNTLVKL